MTYENLVGSSASRFLGQVQTMQIKIKKPENNTGHFSIFSIKRGGMMSCIHWAQRVVTSACNLVYEFSRHNNKISLEKFSRAQDG